MNQLALYDAPTAARRRRSLARSLMQSPRMCAGCRTREARYGVQDDASGPHVERAQTLCFDCFRMQISWRQDIAANRVRGWNGSQKALPLDETLDALDRRRRRAQIAARHALGV